MNRAHRSLWRSLAVVLPLLGGSMLASAPALAIKPATHVATRTAAQPQAQVSLRTRPAGLMAGMHPSVGDQGRVQGSLQPRYITMPVSHHMVTPSSTPQPHPAQLTPQGLAGQQRASTGKSIQPTATMLKASIASKGRMTSESRFRPESTNIGYSFQGSDYTGWIPPDGGFVAGPHNVMTAINGAMNVLSKGGTLLSSQTLDNFFFVPSFLSGSVPFDPHIVYDPYMLRQDGSGNRGRFLAIATTNDGANSSVVNVNISVDDDLTHGWYTYWLGFNGAFSGDWCDYPEIGFSVNAVYFTCNFYKFSDNSNVTSMIDIHPNFNFDGTGSCCSGWEWWNQQSNAPFTIEPASMYYSINGDGMFLVDADGGGGSGSKLHIFQVTNEGVCCGSGPTLNETDRGVGSYDSPPCATQPDSGYQCLDNGDSRLLGAFWQWPGNLPHPYLYTWHDIACNSGYSCPLYNQVDTSSNTLDRDFYINFGSYFVMYPHVGIRYDDYADMSFDLESNNSNNLLYASTLVIGIPPLSQCGVCNDGPAEYVASGAGDYVRLFKGRNRWGDYSGAWPDPDLVGVWVEGERSTATATNTWQMYDAIVNESGDQTGASSSASLSPAPNSAGWSNQNTTVNISASDSGKGVYYITYSAAGAQPFGPYTSYSTAVAPVISTEGATTVYYSATDNWDNTGATHSITVYLDKTAPTTSVSGVADGGSYTTPKSITLSASDGYSGVQHTYYWLDSSGWLPYTGSITVNTNHPAPHAFYYYSTDNAGNVESYHTIHFTVTIPITLTVPNATSITTTSATLNGTYNLNGLAAGCGYFEYGTGVGDSWESGSSSVVGYNAIGFDTLTASGTHSYSKSATGLYPGSVYTAEMEVADHACPYDETNTYDSGNIGTYRFLTPYTLNPGWTFVAVPTTMTTGTASALATNLNTALGGKLKAIAVLRNGRFRLFVPGYSSDFTLLFAEGVAVLSGDTVNHTWSAGGSLLSAGGSYPLHAGWNLAGPVRQPRTMAEVCSDTGATQVAVYHAGSGYTTYTCSSLPASPPVITDEQSIMLRESSAHTWSQP